MDVVQVFCLTSKKDRVKKMVFRDENKYPSKYIKYISDSEK